MHTDRVAIVVTARSWPRLLDMAALSALIMKFDALDTYSTLFFFGGLVRGEVFPCATFLARLDAVAHINNH